MPSKPKTARRELSSEVCASILALREKDQSYSEIAGQMKLARSTVTTIIHRANRQQNASSARSKRTSRPPKLSDREKRTFIRHIDNNSHDNLTALATSSKSDHQLSRNTVRKYMRSADFLRFRVRKKPYLTVRHKAARLVWTRHHKHWTVKDWSGVVWTDEATYETGLNTRFCFVSRRKGTAMEAKYLKPTFKSGRSTIGVWESIILDTKGPMHVLIKGRRMNSDIYINEILESIGLLFFKRCLTSNKAMIWMNDGAGYHTSKKMIAWGRLHELKRMNWSAQSSDLNPIENLWRIIKIRVSARRHQIHSIEAMEQAIKKEWKLLKMEDYERCIESMPRRIQLVIKAKGRAIKYWSFQLISDSVFDQIWNFQSIKLNVE